MAGIIKNQESSASRARTGYIVTTSEDYLPQPEEETRPSLLLRIRNPKDSEAWAAFVETYTPLVYAYCRRRGLRASDVADVTQEVMMQVSKSIREFSYQPERGRFRDWLGTVTRSKVLRFFRQNAQAGRTGGDAADELARQIEAPESDSVWTEEFQARVLEVALRRVRPGFENATWRAFEKAWLDGRQATAVAVEWGVQVDFVYVAKSRVLKRLREEVATLAEEFPLLDDSYR